MKRQRGALTVITPLIIMLVILFSMLVLDGARLYSVRKEMQTIVNAAATAAADAAQSCGGQDVLADQINQRALAAATAQGFSGDPQEIVVKYGVLEDTGGSGVLGFRGVKEIEQTNAVLVSYSRKEPISLLLPKFLMDNVSLSVNSVVRKEAVAVVSAAGSTASIGGGVLGNLLGALLGQPGYLLDPTSLSSLENTTVRLGDLLTALHINDVVDLLPLKADKLAEALEAIAGVGTPLGTLLDDIAKANGIETIKIEDIIQVVGDAKAPESSEFPVYDLVVSLILNIAKQQHEDGLLNVPLNINDLAIPLVANIKSVSLALHVGTPPTVVIGPARKDAEGEWATRFYAPDVTLKLMVDAELVPIKIDLLLASVSFSLAKLTIPLAVNAGGGYGELVSALCARGSNNSIEFGVHIDREIARIVTGSVDPKTGMVISEPLEAKVGEVQVKVLGIGLINVDSLVYLNATVNGSVPGVEDTIIMDPQYALYCTSDGKCDQIEYQDVGDGLSGMDLDIELNDVEILKTEAGGVDLSGLLEPVTELLDNLLNAVVSSLSEALINPLLKMLGVGLGGISVTVSGANQDAIQILENVTVLDSAG